MTPPAEFASRLISPTALADRLREGVNCPVLTAAEVLEAHSHDFGRIVRMAPTVVVLAAGEEDVVHTLRVARSAGVPVGTRGAGHSGKGQSLCEGGIALVNRAEQGQVRLLDGDRVEVTGRTQWRDLERTLQAAGRTAPVLTNLLTTTVGGTLSSGGYGARSIVHGAQIDHLDRLRLILPDGTAVWCSPEENAELFRFSLAGFGQVGVIEKVVMRTIPYRPFARLLLTRHRSWGELIDAIAWTREWQGATPDHFYAEHRQDKLWSIFGIGHATAEEAEASPLPEPLSRKAPERVNMVVRTEVFVRGSEESPAAGQALCALMCDYCFDLPGLRRFIRFLEEPGRREMVWTRYLDRARLLCLSNPPGGPRFPLEIRAGSEAPRQYGFGLYYKVAPSDQAGIEAAKKVHDACLERCIELGGRPYLYGWNSLDAARRQALYGEDDERLRALRRELDPDGLFNAGRL